MEKEAPFGSLMLLRAVEILIGARSPRFFFEAELRFFKLCVFASLPCDSDPIAWANIVGGSRLLRIARSRVAEQLKDMKRTPAEQERELLRIEEYAGLYNHLMQRKRTPYDLVKADSPRALMARLKRNEREVWVARKIAAYLLRDIASEQRSSSPISRAQVIALKLHCRDVAPIRPITVRSAWQDHRHHAVLSAVAELTQFDISPPRLNQRDFLGALQARVEDRERLREFFGKCAFVSDILANAGFIEIAVPFPAPDVLPRIALELPPLASHEVELLANYSDDYAAMKT